MFVSLHLAEGERFDALRQGFVNVSAQATEDRVRITITDLVPSQPQAEQVQSFLTRSGLQEELAAAGLDAAGGFRVTVEISPAATGFVEAVIVATKVK